MFRDYDPEFLDVVFAGVYTITGILIGILVGIVALIISPLLLGAWLVGKISYKLKIFNLIDRLLDILEDI